MSDLSTIGGRIKYLIDEAKTTIVSTAEQLEGFDRFQLGKLIKNKVKRPDRDLIAQLSSLFETTEEWIWKGVGNIHPKEELSVAKTANTSSVHHDSGLILQLFEKLENGSTDQETIARLKTEVLKLVMDLNQCEKKVINLLEQQQRFEKLLEDKLGMKLN